MRNSFILLFLLIAFIATAQSGKPQDSLRVIDLFNIKLDGLAGDRLDQCIAGSLKSRSVENLVEPFRHREETRQWQSEFWGKWLTAAATAYRYNHDPELRTILDKAVNELLATQTPDGYIGNYQTSAHLQQWDIWGRKYCLLGLLSYYDITKDIKVLRAAGKLADHLITELQASGRPIAEWGNHRGMAASSVLEPVVQLYKYTGEQRYLAFANSIVTSWEEGKGPRLISKAIEDVPVAKRYPKPQQWWTWEQGQKAYEMMSCYEGLLELYRVTGDRNYLDAVRKVAMNIRSTEIMITGSGSSMECWYGGAGLQTIPAVHMMETCVGATWMKLCLQLLRTTGDPLWAHEIEKTFYNSLSGSMTPNGTGWSKYNELAGYRHFGENQCGMGLNCCEASGPRGMMVIPQMAVMENNSGLVVNFFTEMNAQISLGKKNKVQINMHTEYPRSGVVRMEVNPEKATIFDLQIRIPDWCSAAVVKVNDQIQPEPRAGNYLHMKRNWKKGDVVQLELPMHPRKVEAGRNGYYALQYGPLVLAADHRLEQQQDFEILELKQNADGSIPFQLLPSPNGISLAVSIPFKVKAPVEKDTQLVFCDYASAGNTWSKESAYKVWMQELLDSSTK